MKSVKEHARGFISKCTDWAEEDGCCRHSTTAIQHAITSRMQTTDNSSNSMPLSPQMAPKSCVWFQ